MVGGGGGGGGAGCNGLVTFIGRAYTRPIPASFESRRGCFWCVGSWMGQGDSGQGSKLAFFLFFLFFCRWFL